MNKKQISKKMKEIEKKEKELARKIAKIERIKNFARKSKNKFDNELKKAINTAVVAAFGFLMALAWRDLITKYVEEIKSVSPLQGQLFTTAIITIISVIGIVLVTHFVKVENK